MNTVSQIQTNPDTKSVFEHSQGQVYFQSSFEIKYNEKTKSYGMFSTEFIPAKTLILIDCGLHGSQEYIESVVSNDPVYKPFVNELYPRDKDIPTKLIYNCFGNKEKSSLYKYSLERHGISCKKQPIVNDFKCKYCPKAYTRKWYLEQHEKTCEDKDKVI